MPAGPIPKTMSLRFDGVEVAALVDALRQHLPPARGPRRAAQEVVRELDAVVLGDQLRRRLHVSLAELVAAAHQRAELLEHPLGARHVRRLSLDDQLLAARPDADAELRFEVLEVLVVVAEQRFGALVGDLNLANDGGGGNRGNSLTVNGLEWYHKGRGSQVRARGPESREPIERLAASRHA